MLAGLVLLVALIGGVGAIAYRAGLDAGSTAQVVKAGAEGGTVIVRDMRHGYGYGYGWHPFGFFGFFLFIFGFIFLLKLLAFGGRGWHRGGWGGGPGGSEDQARRRHDEWHAGAGQRTEPPSTPPAATGP